MARVLDVVVGRVDLAGPSQRVLAADVVTAEPARVHLPGVEVGAAVDDPFRDQPAHAARAREAVGAEPGRHPESAHLCGTEDELAVRGEGLGPVDEADHARVLQCRCADDGVRHQWFEAVPVRFEQLAVEVLRDAIESPWRGIALVAAHDQPARFGPVIDEQRRIAHGRHVARQARGRRDQVLVGHRDEGHVDADQASNLGREHAAGVDDQLGVDGALVGDHAPHATLRGLDGRHPRVLVDLRAATACPLYERERELAGVDVAVRREIRRAEHGFGGHGREHALGFLCRDELEGEAEGLGPTSLARELLHPLRARREAERADLVPASFQTDLLAKSPVQVDRVHHHPRQAERAAELAD